MSAPVSRRVVVTGMGAVTPLGGSMHETWHALRAGRSGIGPITRFDASTLRSRIAGEIHDIRLPERLSAREARKMDRFMVLGITAADEAVRDSRLVIDSALAPQVGVCMGSAIGGLPMIEQGAKIALEQGPHKLTPFMLPATLINMLVGHLSMLYGTRGYCACTVSACASSAHALGQAARMIERGDATVMLAGGAEAAITPLCIGGFAVMRALSTRNEQPSQASRPFDHARDGFVVSEGAVVLVLEELTHAQERGAHVYAELCGFGFSSDAQHMTLPSVEGPALAIELALKDAGLAAAEVDYVNAHATGTPAGDLNEAAAISRIFGHGSNDADQPLVGSTKSMTGHLLGAAGALELAVCVKAVQEQALPPSTNLDRPDPACSLSLAPSTSVNRQVRVAVSNSFGFGGTNAALVVADTSWRTSRLSGQAPS